MNNNLNKDNIIENSASVLAPASQDSDFPSILSDVTNSLPPELPKNLDSLVRTVTYNPRELGAKDILYHTPSMGRAGFYIINFSSQHSGRRFGGIFVATTGVPSNVDVSINPKLFPPKEPMTIESPTNITGAKSREDAYLDAELSLKANAHGVRARLPLQGYFQKFIRIKGSWVRVDQLVEQGILQDIARPYASLWAMETPFRLCDFVDIIEPEQPLTEELAEHIQKFFDIAGHFATRQPDFKGSNSAQNILTFTASRLGELEAKLRLSHGFHGNLSLQNASLHAELCDNSHLSFEEDEYEIQTYERQVKRGEITIDAYFLLRRFFQATSKLHELASFNIQPDMIKDAFYTSLNKVTSSTSPIS